MKNQPGLQPELWESLVSSGYCTAEGLQGIRAEIERGKWQPLGCILARQGLMSIGQIARLLSIQADQPEIRIGDLAIREGYCNEAQISAALEFQRSENRTALECLMQSKHIDNEQLLRVLICYLEKLEQRVSDSHRAA